MLEVILLDKPYPGQTSPTSFFPDIEIVRTMDELVVSDRNLGSTDQIIVPGFYIVVLSDEGISARLSTKGNFPYFSLLEADIDPPEAILSLQLSWAVSEASKQAGVVYLGGGGVRVKFEQIQGKWQAPSGPISIWMV
jgi:hypothetical protein